MSERRNCTHSVDEYLRWQEEEEFAEETGRDRSVRPSPSPGHKRPRRGTICAAASRHTRAKRRKATPRRPRRLRPDGPRDLQEGYAEEPEDPEGLVQLGATAGKGASRGASRQPLIRSTSSTRTNRLQRGHEGRPATVDDQGLTPLSPASRWGLLHAAASGTWQVILTVMRCLGLRPGEFIHLRWLDDVRPLPDGTDTRSGSKAAGARTTGAGAGNAGPGAWAPVYRPRRYVLDRRYDEFWWLGRPSRQLDAWARMRKPARGDFLFPDLEDHDRPWTSNSLNGALHALADAAGVTTGRGQPGSRRSTRSVIPVRRSSWNRRRSCARRVVDRGLPREFQKTYGKPTDEAMAHSDLRPDHDAKRAAWGPERASSQGQKSERVQTQPSRVGWNPFSFLHRYGRCRTRTCDFYDVNVALYQLS